MFVVKKRTKMQYLGGKYAGISIVELKSKKLSYFITYKDENNVSKRLKIGTSPQITKAKALTILNEKKLEVKILKDRLLNGELNSSPSILDKKKKYFTTLNQVADYYFANNNARSMRAESTKYDYHVRESGIGKMNIHLITRDDLSDFYNQKKIQRSDGRRAGKNKLDIRYRELEEIEKNQKIIQKLVDSQDWRDQNYIKYLEERNRIFELRQSEEAKTEIMNDKELSYSEKAAIIGTLSPKTILIIFQVLNAACNFCIDEGKLKVNPINGYYKKINGVEKIQNVIPRYLSPTEIKDYLSETKHISQTRKNYEHLHLIALLALTTGAREQSLMSIKVKDIDFERRSIKLKNHKMQRYYHSLIVNNEVEEELKNMMNGKKEDDYIFLNSKNNKLSSFPDVMVHILNYTVNYKYSYINQFALKDFRNTVAAHLNIKNVPIAHIQKLLDHSDIKMTLRYAKLRSDDGIKSLQVMGDMLA
jgi:integrase